MRTLPRLRKPNRLINLNFPKLLIVPKQMQVCSPWIRVLFPIQEVARVVFPMSVSSQTVPVRHYISPFHFEVIGANSLFFKFESLNCITPFLLILILCVSLELTSLNMLLILHNSHQLIYYPTSNNQGLFEGLYQHMVSVF